MQIYTGKITAEDFKEVTQRWHIDSMIVDITMHLVGFFAVYLMIAGGFHIPGYWGKVPAVLSSAIIALGIAACLGVVFSGMRILLLFLWKWKAKKRSGLVNYHELFVALLFILCGAPALAGQIILPTNIAAYIGAICLMLSLFLLGVYIMGSVFPDHYIRQKPLRYDGVFCGIILYFGGITGAFILFVSALPAFSLAMWIFVFYLPFWRNTFGITAGYHRYPTHRSFECGDNCGRAFLAAGASARQRDAEWWGTEHLIHHERTEIEAQDPHTPKESFWHAHWGWLWKRYMYPDKIWYAKQFSRGLKDDKLVQEQKKYCNAVVFAVFVLPVLVFGIWGLWSSGELNAVNGLWEGVKALTLGFLSWAVSYQVTLSVNSWSHKFGPKYFTGRNTGDSTDPWYLALLSSGENLQNIHHLMDFLACYWVDRWHPDFTGAVLVALERIGRFRFMKWAGLPYNLKTLSNNPHRLKFLQEHIITNHKLLPVRP